MRLRDHLLLDLIGCSPVALRRFLPLVHLAGGNIYCQGPDDVLPLLAAHEPGECRLNVLREAALAAAVGRFFAASGMPWGAPFVICLDGWRPYPQFRDPRLGDAFARWARPFLDEAGYFRPLR
jgi:hypothetical protein